MRKLQIAEADLMQLAIREEINRSEEARYDHRLHGLLLVSTGRSCTEVGALFGEAATTIQRWVRRFEESGFAGLREGDRSGRPRALDERSWRRVEAVFLPPYSPQLSTFERVWKLTWRTATHNRHFATLQDVLDAVTKCFSRWRKPNETLRRLCCIT
jgi:hypothetical protein